MIEEQALEFWEAELENQYKMYQQASTQQHSPPNREEETSKLSEGDNSTALPSHVSKIG